MRKSARTLIALAGIAAFAAGGSAFTASNTLPTTSTVGYGSVTVSGAVVNSIAYSVDAAGTTVTAVNLVLAGDLTGKSVSVALNALNADACVLGTVTTGTVTSPYTCTLSASSVSTTALTATHVIVHD